MATSITTKIAKEKLIKARCGEKPLPKVIKMAFGNGGTNELNEPLEIDFDKATLNNEIGRKNIDGYKITDYNKCEYFCTLLENEFINEKITEVALIDEENDIIAIKNFKPKYKDNDMQLRFFIEDEF
ncbi:phage tail-collar fiber domain-containing protein [[Clostridium] colinum]|uniref:phage tail-collar fiber domain-containing protein n=1 Tax=[Clostridium] colinum TaxID=36835 RepID=UPI002024A09D|nr:phage tail protein [[Clostridium] colinum]